MAASRTGRRRDFAIIDAVPWGRDAAEYEAFFGLRGLGAELRILDCGAGPSSFTAEMAAQGRPAVAVDPLYRLDASTIERQVAEAGRVMLDGLVAAHQRFVWDHCGSPEALIACRLATMRRFLCDYEAGRQEGRYLAAALPHLPFPDGSFDLVLCSHLLFLYDHRYDFAFHAAAIDEMLRVGREVRVFPLLDLGGQPSALLEGVTQRLRDRGLRVEILQVGYEFQKGGDRMLRAAWR
jgi:SAM-dependent methyltransferase